MKESSKIISAQSFIQLLENQADRANEKSITAYLRSANVNMLREIAFEVIKTENITLLAKLANLVSQIRRDSNVRLDGETDSIIWAFTSNGLARRKRQVKRSFVPTTNKIEVINLDRVLNLLKTLSHEELMIVRESCCSMLAEQ